MQAASRCRGYGGVKQRSCAHVTHRQPVGHLSRSPRLLVNCEVRARWCIEVRYGYKQEATSLLHDWVKDVGAEAGLSLGNTRIASGAIGVPESRLELEVTFSSVAEWERFLARIPIKLHRAWSQRIQGMIVDGSPKWEIYRAVPLEQSIHDSASSTVGSNLQPVVNSHLNASSLKDIPIQAGSKISETVKSASPALTIIEGTENAEVILDWKGEPMKINPGDKLPFKFL